jgi:hypothetical protein
VQVMLHHPRSVYTGSLKCLHHCRKNLGHHISTSLQATANSLEKPLPPTSKSGCIDVNTVNVQVLQQAFGRGQQLASLVKLGSEALTW